MTDRIEYFENSLIQHGKENDRVYLMKFGSESADRLIDYIETLSEQNNYTKIFTKIPVSKSDAFLQRGYIQEAFIPNFFKGKEDCLFLVKYPDPERQNTDKAKIESIISGSLAKKYTPVSEPEEFILEELTSTDAGEITALYKTVFPSYPFPIFDPAYIRETMADNLIYFGARKEGKIVALSSAESDYKGQNTEMTDFATHPDYRGYNLSLYLLEKMETRMRELGIKTVWTIARSLSFGMNTTFARAGYEFGGTLINNTNIFGHIESMNIWYKPL